MYFFKTVCFVCLQGAVARQKWDQLLDFAGCFQFAEKEAQELAEINIIVPQLSNTEYKKGLIAAFAPN